MKSSVTITMMIVGGCLVLAPFAFNAIHEHQLSAILVARTDFTSVQFGDAALILSPLSRFGCWFTGTGMTVVAIISAAKETKRPETALSRPINVA